MSNEKIDNVLELADATSGILGAIDPKFSVIPLVTYVIRRTVGKTPNNDVVKRIKKLEKKLKEKKISIEEFGKELINIPEHEKYFLSNSLQYIIINCIPEAVDVYISIFIDCVMKEEHHLEEELCEIIEGLNSNDILLLKRVNDFIKNGDKSEYDSRLEEKKNRLEEMHQEKIEVEKYNSNPNNKVKKPVLGLIDRSSFIDDNRTIFWKDFGTFCGFPDVSLNLLMLVNDEEETFYGALFTKSIMKLNDLGVIQLDHIVTIGTSNLFNIDRFHITILGEKILEYVENDN